MSDEIEIMDEEMELMDEELEEMEETLEDASASVVHDEETQALMQAEGLMAEEMEAEEEPDEIFVEQEQLFSLIESLLFASPRPVSFEIIKQVFKDTNIKTKDLRRALQDYSASLAESNRGVYLEEVAGGYQLRTKLDNVQFLKNSTKQKPFRVSGPSMETLAIIAYKQPCIKAEVDTIRGVESGHLIRVLMDKGLVQFDGKSDLPGKPMLYKTTRKFLEVFGLRNIRELPSLEEIEQLIPEGIESAEDKTTLDQLTGELSLDYALRDMEAEEELDKISNRLGEISTTSEYFEQEKVRQREQKEKDRADDIRERILLGQLVDDNEMNWLKRYELRKEEEAQALAEAQAAGTNSIEESVSSLSEEAGGLDSSAEEGPASEMALAAALEFELEDEEKKDISHGENLDLQRDLASLGASAESESATESAESTPLESKEEAQTAASSEDQPVSKKLLGLAGSALDAFKAFDEDESEDEAQNKIDI